MLLRYCDNLSNFGDAINPSFWSHFAPDCLDDDPRELFYGIGTILSEYIPRGPMKVVLGAGTGYGAPPAVTAKWRIYFVRGPLSATALGISRSYALTDPVILLPLWLPPAPAKRHRVSYMPHHMSAKQADWSAVCRDAGLHYIDPDAPAATVADDISASELLITEALHGAVAADAYRVPWLPVAGYRYVLEFKWADWCASLNLPYLPARLRPLWDISFRGGIGQRIKIAARRALYRSGFGGSPTREPRPLTSPPADFAWTVEALSTLAGTGVPYLSADREHRSATERVAEAVDRFTRDRASRTQYDANRVNRLDAAPNF